MSYLDKTGLTHFFEKLKSVFAPKERGVEYIRGTWTAASGAWTGVTKDSELYDGKQILLYMPFAGSGNATLNLTLAGGGTTGAKNVYFESTTRFTTHKGQNSQLPLVYHKALKLSNGNTYEGWWYLANRDTTDIYKLGSVYNSWKALAAIYRYQLLLTVDEEYLVPVNSVNNSQATNKTLTTAAFDPFGQIWYWNSANTIAANAKLGDWNSVTSHYNNGLIDLRYSFNTGTGLTANKPVYLVCVPQADGKAKLHTAPISQSLPIVVDGLIYKYLGRAYDNYRITLDEHKPCYMYKNGGVREISGWAEYAGDAAKVNGHTVNTDVPSGAKFTDTTYTAASAAPGKIAKDSAQGTSTNYARQDHTHGIDVGTGDANGQVKIAGQNASVKGLAALAYKASLAEADIPTISIDGKTSGTLPVSRGGTGKTTAKDAANDFMNALDTGSSTPADADYYISQYVNGGNTTKTYHRRPMSALWAYIQGKIQGWAKNLTAKGNLGWTDQTAGKIPVTNNTLAYWDGRYNGSSSNLSYCAKGAFGNLAVKDSLTASDIPELNASKITAGTFSAARLPVATEDANGIVNNTYIRKMNELWETHEATTVNNSVVSGAFAITINATTSWRQDSYTDYWYTKINLPTIKRGAEIVIRYDDCQFLYMLEPPEDGWIEALDGEVWLYTKTVPDFSVINSPDWIRVSAYFINHTSIDSGRYNPPFKMEKIWENANPTATFPPQMLDLNLRAYDMAVIETLGLPSSNDQGICYVTGIIVKGVTSAIMGTAKTSNRVGLRKYTMSDEGIDIAEGIYNAGVNNNYFVPSRIYGIRGLSEFDVEPVWETWMEEGEENSNLFYEGFNASLQNNGNTVLDYGWRTYDGITGWLINTRAQGNSWAYLYSNDKIDVTNYSYIVVDCYFYCYGGAAYVGLTQQNAPAGNNPANVMPVNAHPVSTRTKFRGEVRLNVKDLTGEYRLVIACAGSGESSYQGYSMIISVKAR